MAKSETLLDRLLHAPDLATIVPHLQPDVLHRVIQICGLEDCVEFVALATPAQLTSVLDADLWRARPGADDELDVDRFGVWLEVLMQTGGAVAAQKLAALDIELVIAGFARHVSVFENAAVSSYTILDGEQTAGRDRTRVASSEIGGYLIEAKHTSWWDTINDVLVLLDAEQTEYFHRLMRGCVRLSNEGREADGFHDLLEDDEQDMFDLASDREARREQQGFVTAAQGRAFLQSARQLRLDGAEPPANPVARAYFRAVEAAPNDDGGSTQQDPPYTPPLQKEQHAPYEDGVIAVLRDAGVLSEQPRALLEAGEGSPARLALIRAYIDAHATSAEELAFLANALIAGCSIQGRPFTTREASDAAAALCNLGLDHWPERWRDRDLVTAFQIGWTVLHRDVGMFAAERLIEVIADLKCRDRAIQLRLHGLRRALMQHVRDRAPWRARPALDAILMLDASAWAVLVALLDECPVLHAAIDAAQRSRRQIDPGEFVFVSENSQIAVVRDFMRRLPSTLTH